ncbi:acetoacetate decarboxylase (ADC) [Pseudoduganella sp. CY13W]|uniref:Acetoacetate decarboxylase (ADC) n=2 Tax=Duganella qianjiadongensis TaxID=2692176 RepID=A0ABW9VGS4_9BURK|nr:acetoacetate decarboxylase (ADC) [Duganella qianjiadongensis]
MLAPTQAAPVSTIMLAGQSVPVQAGGLYERYRSNPPLSVVAAEHPELDLSWFKTLPKQKVEIGFTSYSPNYYYRNSKITLVYTADLARLRSLIPAALRAQVQPLQVWPGRGAVAITAYAYELCDNDSYNELSLAIVTNAPGQRSYGPLSLLAQSRAGQFWGYVLKLPVNTELARVRGVVGYKLPKWLARIDYTAAQGSVRYALYEGHDAAPALLLEGQKLADTAPQMQVLRHSFVNLDHAGRPSVGYALSRHVRAASSSRQEAATLSLGKGELADYVRSLQLGRLLKYEYVPEFQSALYAPVPLGRNGATQ